MPMVRSENTPQTVPTVIRSDFLSLELPVWISLLLVPFIFTSLFLRVLTTFLPLNRFAKNRNNALTGTPTISTAGVLAPNDVANLDNGSIILNFGQKVNISV